MARYNGKPKASKPDRYEVALCGKDVFGVYDNNTKRFVISDVTKEVATVKKWDLQGALLDKMLIGLYKKAFS